MHRNALFLQHPLKDLVPARRRPQQYDNIPAAYPAQFPALLVRHPKCPQQLPDFCRHTIGFLLFYCQLPSGAASRLPVLRALRAVCMAAGCARRLPASLVLPAAQFIRPLTGLKKQQLRQAAPFLRTTLLHGIHRARMQGRQIVIDDAAHILPHDLFKDPVGHIQDFPTAPEILMQVDLPCILGLAALSFLLISSGLARRNL